MTIKSAYITLALTIIHVLAIAQTIPTENQNSKKIHSEYVNEIIFQFSDTEINNINQRNGVRTTMFTNFKVDTHIEFSNSFGVIHTIGIRNVGIKSLDETINQVTYDKIKRRAFLLGTGLALKTGNFNKHFFIYGGGEYELAFHYRQKIYTSTFKSILRQGEWFSSATERFLPSIFAGIQFTNGINIQTKYYLKDFLNHSYNGVLGDFTKFTQSHLFYLSFTLQFKDKKFPKVKETKPEIIDL